VATYGNLAHRVLTLTYRNFDGKVPAPVNLDETDRLMAASCKEVSRKWMTASTAASLNSTKQGHGAGT